MARSVRRRMCVGGRPCRRARPCDALPQIEMGYRGAMALTPFPSPAPRQRMRPPSLLRRPGRGAWRCVVSAPQRHRRTVRVIAGAPDGAARPGRPRGVSFGRGYGDAPCRMLGGRIPWRGKGYCRAVYSKPNGLSRNGARQLDISSSGAPCAPTAPAQKAVQWSGPQHGGRAMRPPAAQRWRAGLVDTDARIGLPRRLSLEYGNPHHAYRNRGACAGGDR